jgi:hypothetical protein
MEFSEPNDIQKNSIVERFNRTLAGYIKKLRIGSKNYNWPKALTQIMENYNSSYHRMIRNTPFDIFYKNGVNDQDIIIVPRIYSVGDKVRLKIKKKVFGKGDELTYSKEIYTIEQIDRYKYYLNNGKGYSSNKFYKVDGNDNNDIEESNNDEEVEHLNRQKEKRISRKLKQGGLDTSLILNTKRNR